MKIHALRAALTLLAGTLLGFTATAQTVYRCGSAYSRPPCPGAITLDASDSRTPVQKAEADATTAQASILAASLEKERLAREKLMAA